jgi:peroxiredoxin
VVLTHTPFVDLSFIAKDFSLLSINGSMYNLNALKGPNGLVLIFMCNHCPYVKAIIKKLNEDAKKLISYGIGVAGINANDAIEYPDDSYDNMKAFASQHSIIFPYLHDATQEIAKAYNAVCTPDFFGFNKDLNLRYRGRFDDSGMSEKVDTKRELLSAMTEIAETGECKMTQYPSMGCNIKWKNS